MKRLVANWPMDENRAEVLMQEYENLFAGVGEQRFNRGVGTIIREGRYQFFPSMAEFRGFVPAGEQRWKPCGKCEEGFIRVPDPEAELLYGDPGATKMIFCKCRFSNIGSAS